MFYYIVTKLRTFHNDLNYYTHKLCHIQVYKYFQLINDQLQCVNHPLIDVLSIQLMDNKKLWYKCEKSCFIKNNSGICKCGLGLETLHHYLFTCNIYENQRNWFMFQIVYIYNFYNIPITVKNIMFPPSNITNQHRKHILDALCIYVIKTQRFRHYI